MTFVARELATPLVRLALSVGLSSFGGRSFAPNSPLFSGIEILDPTALDTERGNIETFKTGAPGRSRTCDLMLRRHVLYPAELRARGLAD